MYLIVIGWMYVVLMMSVAEATGTNGSFLGAIVTFFLYGLVPLSLVVYLMLTPQRRKGIREREAAEDGTPWYAIARHMLGMRHGQRGARRWRQVWSNHKLKPLPAREVWAQARAVMLEDQLKADEVQPSSQPS